jgi:hypothetical protein
MMNTNIVFTLYHIHVNRVLDKCKFVRYTVINTSMVKETKGGGASPGPTKGIGSPRYFFDEREPPPTIHLA